MSTDLKVPGALEILMALESPLLPGLAPELLDLKARAAKVAAELDTPEDCSPCQKKRVQAMLAAVAYELNARVAGNPELAGVLPTLLVTAEQNLSHA